MTVGSQAFRLTALSESDVPRLLWIDKAAFGKRRILRPDYRAMMRSPDYRLLGVGLIGEPRHLVGHLWASYFQRSVSICHVAVMPEHQRQRVATALIARLSTWAFKHRTADSVSIIVPEWATEMRQLCLRLGFHFVELIAGDKDGEYEIYAVDKRVQPDDWQVGHSYRYCLSQGRSKMGVLNKIVYRRGKRIGLKFCGDQIEWRYGTGVIGVNRVSIDVPEK